MGRLDLLPLLLRKRLPVGSRAKQDQGITVGRLRRQGQRQGEGQEESSDHVPYTVRAENPFQCRTGNRRRPPLTCPRRRVSRSTPSAPFPRESTRCRASG